MAAIKDNSLLIIFKQKTMKPILKLLGLLFILVIQTTIYSQSISQKRVLVYFETGVQRNDINCCQQYSTTATLNL
jgi:hypothetical protein